MAYVSGHFVMDLFQALQRCHIDVDELIGDIPIDWNAAEHRHPLIDWRIFVELMGRLEREVGGSEGLERLGELIADMKPAPVLRRMAGLSANPRLLFSAAHQWALRRAFPDLETNLQVLPDGRLSIVARVPERDAPCPQIFRLGLGGARALPRVLQLPDAVVSARIEERQARYTIALPPSGTLFARLRRTLQALFSARAALAQLEAQQLELRGHFEALRRSHADLQESESRYRILAEAVADVIVEFDRSGRIQFISPSVQELTGYRPDQIVGSNWRLWLHPDDVKRAKERAGDTLSDCAAALSSPMLRVRHECGDWLWLDSTLRSFATGAGDTHLVAVLRDANERVREATRLARRNAWLEDTVAHHTAQIDRRNQDIDDLRARLEERAELSERGEETPVPQAQSAGERALNRSRG